jgi:DNA-binding transcriptional LysR family regulator
VDKLQAMEVFVAVAEEQGFNGAARRLRLSAPSVTRAVAALEQHLGVRLFNRTTRQVKTTEAGDRYLEDARRLLAEIQTAEESASGVNAEPRGLLTITAPVLFGRIYVTPTIVEYLSTFPSTQINALFLDRVVNMMEEGVDVCVRIGQLPDSSLRAKRVGSVRHVLCASPAYLDQAGLPDTPAALNQHQLISSSSSSFTHEWRFAGSNAIRLTPRLVTATNDAAIEAALLGAGIVRCLSYQVEQHIASHRLVRLLPSFEPAAEPVHILHREGGQFETPKIRAFINMLELNLLRTRPVE